MGRIHAIMSDGTVVTDVEVCTLTPFYSQIYINHIHIGISFNPRINRSFNFIILKQAFRKLYEAVGLGWVYAITKFQPVSP